ncbi:hypothetical protein P7K49_032156 [Saguinus oedipus]|uniref:Uncharacterized protein n=1 Tax=Saguinus oedipus TaxID=9490 RepID=A0ABQ9TYA7_SAGOE|nr:hypothetical protein P7K49_032156 [Saguinus oedipus]
MTLVAGAVVLPVPQQGSSSCSVNGTGSPSDRCLELREGRAPYYGLKKEARREIPRQKSTISLITAVLAGYQMQPFMKSTQAKEQSMLLRQPEGKSNPASEVEKYLSFSVEDKGPEAAELPNIEWGCVAQVEVEKFTALPMQDEQDAERRHLVMIAL